MTPHQSFTIRAANNVRHSVTVLFEDDQFIALNKPPRLALIPERWNPAASNLLDILKAKYQKHSHDASASIWVVHRIDAETSGAVLFAKTAEMHKALNQLFERGKINKTYLAIVRGAPPQDKSTIDLPIAPHPKQKNHMQAHPKGKPSLTYYEVLERFRDFALLEVRPKTGRTHQIRVHLAAINCPLAIDKLYGSLPQLSIANIKTNYRPKGNQTAPSPLMDRLTLHASALDFHDPMANIRRIIEAPLPGDFQALLKALRKYDQ